MLLALGALESSCRQGAEMKVVVTGGQGQLGQYVVRELAAAGDEVTVFDRVPGPETGGATGRVMR